MRELLSSPQRPAKTDVPACFAFSFFTTITHPPTHHHHSSAFLFPSPAQLHIVCAIFLEHRKHIANSFNEPPAPLSLQTAQPTKQPSNGLGCSRHVCRYRNIQHDVTYLHHLSRLRPSSPVCPRCQSSTAASRRSAFAFGKQTDHR